jgi:hypothetical protein
MDSVSTSESSSLRSTLLSSTTAAFHTFSQSLVRIPKLTGAFTEQELLISTQTLWVKENKHFAIGWAVLGFQEPAGILKNMLSVHHTIVASSAADPITTPRLSLGFTA